jgi:hypothetical protein
MFMESLYNIIDGKDNNEVYIDNNNNKYILTV